MPVTAPTAELSKLIKRLEGVSKNDFRQSLSASMATQARTLVSKCFETGKDPYGNAWAPLKLRHGQPLRDTGRLGSTAAWEVEATPERFSLTNRMKQVQLMQNGGVIQPVTARMLRFVPRGSNRAVFAKRVVVPARPMVPVSGLPPAWAHAFESVVNKLIDRRMRYD